MFNQTLEDVENVYRDVGGYDMSYDEFKVWEEDFNYLRINRSKKEDGGR